MVKSYRLQWKITDYITSMFWLWITMIVLVFKTVVAVVIKCKAQKNWHSIGTNWNHCSTVSLVLSFISFFSSVYVQPGIKYSNFWKQTTRVEGREEAKYNQLFFFLLKKLFLKYTEILYTFFHNISKKN